MVCKIVKIVLKIVHTSNWILLVPFSHFCSCWTQPLTFLNTFPTNEVNITAFWIQETVFWNNSANILLLSIKQELCYIATTQKGFFFDYGGWWYLDAMHVLRGPTAVNPFGLYARRWQQDVYLNTHSVFLLVRNKTLEKSSSFSTFLSVVSCCFLCSFPRLSAIIVFYVWAPEGLKNEFWTDNRCVIWIVLQRIFKMYLVYVFVWYLKCSDALRRFVTVWQGGDGINLCESFCLFHPEFHFAVLLSLLE